MADSETTNGQTAHIEENAGAQAADVKGKGKSTEAEPVPVVEDDDVESEEEGQQESGAEDEEADDDDMAEIDEDNIVADGRRTRGKAIDFAKAAEDLGDEEDDDEEDDGDFEDPDDSMTG